MYAYAQHTMTDLANASIAIWRAPIMSRVGDGARVVLVVDRAMATSAYTDLAARTWFGALLWTPSTHFLPCTALSYLSHADVGDAIYATSSRDLTAHTFA